MTWYWEYDYAEAADDAAPGRSVDFPTQADAEGWVGEGWRDLRAQGVVAVTLHEDGRVAYGPMSLDA
jgi:hypothetical protein